MDSAIEIGIVCARCDAYSAMDTPTCASCGNDLALMVKPSTAGPVSGRASNPGSGRRIDAAPSGLFEDPLRPRRRPTPGEKRAISGAHDVRPAVALSQEELMDQAKNFVCRSCSTPVPMGHKFCGRCGAAVPPEIL